LTWTLLKYYFLWIARDISGNMCACVCACVCASVCLYECMCVCECICVFMNTWVYLCLYENVSVLSDSHLWPLFKGGRCSKVALHYKSWNWNSKMVVAIRKCLLTQVWLFNFQVTFIRDNCSTIQRLEMKLVNVLQCLIDLSLQIRPSCDSLFLEFMLFRGLQLAFIYSIIHLINEASNLIHNIFIYFFFHRLSNWRHFIQFKKCTNKM